VNNLTIARELAASTASSMLLGTKHEFSSHIFAYCYIRPAIAAARVEAAKVMICEEYKSDDADGYHIRPAVAAAKQQAAAAAQDSASDNFGGYEGDDDADNVRPARDRREGNDGALDSRIDHDRDEAALPVPLPDEPQKNPVHALIDIHNVNYNAAADYSDNDDDDDYAEVVIVAAPTTLVDETSRDDSALLQSRNHDHSSDGLRIQVLPKYTDYNHRGPMNHCFALYEYGACVKRSANPKPKPEAVSPDEACMAVEAEAADNEVDDRRIGSGGHRPTGTRFSFSMEHPLQDTYKQMLNSKYAVPMLAGAGVPKHPGPQTLGSSWRSLANAFAEYMLVLFVPWKLDCTRPPLPLTWEAFCAWYTYDINHATMSEIKELGQHGADMYGMNMNSYVARCRREVIASMSNGLRVSSLLQRVSQMYRNRDCDRWNKLADDSKDNDFDLAELAFNTFGDGSNWDSAIGGPDEVQAVIDMMNSIELMKAGGNAASSRIPESHREFTESLSSRPIIAHSNWTLASTASSTAIWREKGSAESDADPANSQTDGGTDNDDDDNDDDDDDACKALHGIEVDESGDPVRRGSVSDAPDGTLNDGQNAIFLRIVRWCKQRALFDADETGALVCPEPLYVLIQGGGGQ
jgi:hypothetical protein